MDVQKQTRQVGDIGIALAATLKRPNGDVVDLNGLTVKFTMVHSNSGAVKVAESSTGVSTTDADAGEVQKVFLAADVDTVGIYHAYFVVEHSGGQDTFPAKTGEMEVSIMPLAQS